MPLDTPTRLVPVHVSRLTQISAPLVRLSAPATSASSIPLPLVSYPAIVKFVLLSGWPNPRRLTCSHVPLIGSLVPRTAGVRVPSVSTLEIDDPVSAPTGEMYNHG